MNMSCLALHASSEASTTTQAGQSCIGDMGADEVLPLTRTQPGGKMMPSSAPRTFLTPASLRSVKPPDCGVGLGKLKDWQLSAMLVNILP